MINSQYKFQTILIYIIVFFVIMNSCKKDEITNPSTSRPPIAIDTIAKPMNIYFGNLHAHTNYSDGSGSPADGYKWAKDVAKMDFYAITDHAEELVGDEWYDIGKQAKKFTQNGRFVALRGFEWSSVFDGHANIYNSDYYVNAILYPTAGNLFRWLQENKAYAQFNHPGYDGKSFNNLEYKSNAAKNFVAIETGNDMDGNNSGLYINYYGIALDNGWKVGPTNNLDNHSLTDNKHRTAILAEKLTSASILEAFAARRFYSTDDPDIKIKFRYKDHWMGSSVKDTGNIVFNIDVEDNEPINTIELITGKGVVADFVSVNNSLTIYSWSPVVHVNGPSYFYIKITSQNILETDLPFQISVTAPIWFNY
jgi:hypothetical protein